MIPLSVPHPEAVALLVDQATALEDALSSIDDLDLLDASRCRGWSRLDTVVHVRLGLDELLGAWSTRTDVQPTHDAASYWSSHPDDRDDDPVPHVLWLRRTASAYERPTRAVAHLALVTDRLLSALDQLDQLDQLAPATVRFQGKVLTSGDLLATWVVELVVHHLDLDLDPGTAPEPADAALELTRRTLEAVAGGALPSGLEDATAVLVALGRVPWPPHLARSSHLPVAL